MFLKTLNYLDANVVIDTTFRGERECDVYKGNDLQNLSFDNTHRYIIIFPNGDLYVRYPIGWRFNVAEVLPLDDDETIGDIPFIIRNNAYCWFIDPDTVENGWCYTRYPIYRMSCNLKNCEWLDLD